MDPDLSWLFGIGQAAAANGIPPPSIDSFGDRFNAYAGAPAGPPVQAPGGAPAAITQALEPPQVPMPMARPADAPGVFAFDPGGNGGGAPVVADTTPDLGASLAPEGTAGQKYAGPIGPQQPSGPGSDPKRMNDLLATLRGVQVAQPPAPQRVATPALPRPTGAIQGGQIIALLNALGMAPQAPQLPTTLGQGLGRG